MANVQLCLNSDPGKYSFTVRYPKLLTDPVKVTSNVC